MECFLPASESDGLISALLALQTAVGWPGIDLQVCYSSILEEPPPAGCQLWLLLSAFRQLQPLLPTYPSAFVLALVVWRCGRRTDVSGEPIALAETTSETSRCFLVMHVCTVIVLLLLVTVEVFSLQHSRQVQRQESLESLTEALTVLTQHYQQEQQALAQFEQQKSRVKFQARNLQHNQCYRQFLQQLSVAVPPHCG